MLKIIQFTLVKLSKPQKEVKLLQLLRYCMDFTVAVNMVCFQ